MFTVNLQEKMLKEKKAKISVLEETNSLLTKFAEEDNNLLRIAGFRLPTDKSNTENQINKLNQELKEGDIFSSEEIRKVAQKYGLRFLEVSCYRGNLPSNITTVIRESMKKDGKPDCYSGEFYIMAPAASFELQTKPKDPLLFRHFSGDNYRLLTKWGNDLSSLRKIRIYPFRSIGRFFLSLLLISLMVIFGLPQFTSFRYFNGSQTNLAISIIFTVIVGFTALVLVVAGNEFNFIDENWNSRFRS